MNIVLRNTIAVVLGFVVGMLVNGFIVSISGSIIPPPEGVDTQTIEGLKKTMHLFEPKHFLMPFLAHAIGTLVGALLVALIAKSHQMRLALLIGVTSLAGGIMMVMSVPSPLWFTVIDLGIAYIPMAYLGAKLAEVIVGK